LDIPALLAGTSFFSPTTPLTGTIVRMTIYNKVATLTKINAAYIAGIIDGEGTITLTSKHKYANRQLAITISNTEIPLLECIIETIEAGKITHKKPTKNSAQN